MAEFNFIQKPEELVGKTIAKAKTFEGYSHERLMLHFTDGTIAIVNGRGGYDGDCELVFNESLDDYELKAAGLMSEEEYDRRCEESNRRHREVKENQERATYEALKKKFDGK